MSLDLRSPEDAPDDGNVERPVWFGPSDRPLFGWIHHPADGLARGGVVLCPPLAREWTNAHYCYRLLAQRLAAAGMLAVRFDYDGTGDSAGGDDDPHRVESWLASIVHAVALARDSGSRAVSLLGMRMGAQLAAASAARVGPLDAVVLWDPCSSARAFLREQAALQRMVLDGPPAPDGAIELPGAVLSEKTVADLTSLPVERPPQPPARVLLLTRPSRPPMSDLAGALGAPTDQVVAHDQDRLLEVDLAVRQMPAPSMGEIVAWLARAQTTPTPVSARGRDRAAITTEGAILTERAVRLGPAGLFAMVTEPELATPAPTVLFVNSGNNCHVGPSRLWVDLARRWAALGVRCVRMDESGLGDSPTRPGQPAQVVWSPDHFDDLSDARQAIEPDDPTDVIVVGLCSGGYQALESALAQPVRAVYALNPVLHFAPPELDGGRIDPRRQICWPTGGLVHAYRWLTIDPVRRRLRRLAWGLAHLMHPDRNPSAWLDQLQDNGADVLIVCGADEARSFGVSTGALAEYTGSPGQVTIDVVAGLDHALVPAWQRADVAARMTDRLVARHLPPASERSNTEAAASIGSAHR